MANRNISVSGINTNLNQALTVIGSPITFNTVTGPTTATLSLLSGSVYGPYVLITLDNSSIDSNVLVTIESNISTDQFTSYTNGTISGNGIISTTIFSGNKVALFYYSIDNNVLGNHIISISTQPILTLIGSPIITNVPIDPTTLTLIGPTFGSINNQQNIPYTISLNQSVNPNNPDISITINSDNSNDSFLVNPNGNNEQSGNPLTINVPQGTSGVQFYLTPKDE